MKLFALSLCLYIFLAPQTTLAEPKEFEIELCSEVFDFNGEAYFCGKHRRYGKELFRSNGTPGGTNVVADIYNGERGSNPQDFFILGDRLYFFAENKLTGREIWKTDGTPTGTKRVTDAYPGPNGFSSGQGYMFPDGGVVYINSPEGLWRTNGRSDGTVNLDLPFPLTAFGGSLYYFDAPAFEESDADLTLHKLSKNSLQAEVVKNFGAGCFASTDWNVDKTENSNKFYFIVRCNDNNGGYTSSTYASDGTTLGTIKVIEDGDVSLLGDLNGTRYFFNRVTEKIQSTNGVTTNTIRDCSIKGCSGANSDNSSFFDGSSMILKDTLFFNMYEDDTGEQLWSTDGTVDGTAPLNAPSVFDYATNGEQLIYRRNPGRHSDDIWVTDGTVNGTEVLIPANGNDARGVYSIGSEFLIFFRNSSSRGFTLWASSGSFSSTRKLKTFTGSLELFQSGREGNRFYFPVDGVLWHTNAEPGGTYKVTYIDNIESTRGKTDWLTSIISLLLDDD